MGGFYHLPRLYTTLNVFSVLYIDAPKGWVYPNHKHPLFEILYCASGEMVQWINGQAYRLRAGETAFIKSGVYHYPEAIEDSVYLNFHFDIDLKDLYTLFQSVTEPLLGHGEPAEKRQEIRLWMEKLIGEFRNTKEAKEERDDANPVHQVRSSLQTLRMQSIVIDFILFVADLFTRSGHIGKEATVQPSHANIAAEVAYWLEQSGDGKVRIQQLARQLNVHRTYISNCFKMVYGISPQNYMAQIRVRRAKQLLQETTLPISEIADDLSFSSTAHFCRFFRSRVGCSPLQYRAKQFEAYSAVK